MHGEELAPVIPLFGGAVPVAPHHREPDQQWHASWIGDADDGADSDDDSIDDAADGDTNLDIAERTLLRRLRARSLSVSEARDLLRDYDLEPDEVERLLERFQGLGYLDDTLLAEQIVHVGADRKGQGRRVIAQTMTKRGIPREVADAVLAELPDDDHERALEFARTKAKSMAGLDRDTALRRLTGQLGRRGYGGSVAMTAARAALEEVQTPASGVRFR